MVWAAISFMTFPTVLDGRYRTILEDHVHPMVQTLYPEGGGEYQCDNAPKHTARLVTEWFVEVEHLL